jgi:hypothetical protein
VRASKIFVCVVVLLAACSSAAGGKTTPSSTKVPLSSFHGQWCAVAQNFIATIKSFGFDKLSDPGYADSLRAEADGFDSLADSVNQAGYASQAVTIRDLSYGIKQMADSMNVTGGNLLSEIQQLTQSVKELRQKSNVAIGIMGAC